MSGCADRAGNPQLISLRPGDEPDEQVQEHSSRRAVQWGSSTCEKTSETLCQPPDRQRPHKGGHQSSPDRATHQQAEADQQLGEREQCVPKSDVRREEVRYRDNGSSDHSWIACSARYEHRGDKAASEHRRLQLQNTVEDPQEPERNLHAPLAGGCAHAPQERSQELPRRHSLAHLSRPRRLHRRPGRDRGCNRHGDGSRRTP